MEFLAIEISVFSSLKSKKVRSKFCFLVNNLFKIISDYDLTGPIFSLSPNAALVVRGN